MTSVDKPTTAPPIPDQDARTDKAVTEAALFEAFGGVRGMVETVLPGLLFVTIYTINKNLQGSAIAAHGVSLLLVAVRLTPTEWHLLEVLVRNGGRLVSQKQLLQEVWGPSYGTESNYLRVYMAQLRRKLASEPSHPRHDVTEAGMGYRFER